MYDLGNSQLSEICVKPDDFLRRLCNINDMFEGYRQHDAHEAFKVTMSVNVVCQALLVDLSLQVIVDSLESLDARVEKLKNDAAAKTRGK